jgi:hypothetical protein
MELPLIPTAVVLNVPCLLLPSGDIIVGLSLGSFSTLGQYLTIKAV